MAKARHDTLRDTLVDYGGRLVKAVAFLLSRQPGTRNTGHIWAIKDVSFEVRTRTGHGDHRSKRGWQEHAAEGAVPDPEPTSGGLSSWADGLPAGGGDGLRPGADGAGKCLLERRILGMRKAEIERKFDEIVEFSGVEKFIDTPVKRYSSGMYVRLAFAVAAHLEPEILIVDEVLAVGDAEFHANAWVRWGTLLAGPNYPVCKSQHVGRSAPVFACHPAEWGRGSVSGSQRCSGRSLLDLRLQGRFRAGLE